VAVSFN